MFHQVTEIRFLCGDGFRVGVYITFIIFVREATGGYIPFRVTITKVSLCGNNNMDIPLFEFGNQVIHEVKMFVFKEISLSVCQFDVP